MLGSSMLYKKLISLYGSSLAGKSQLSDDLVWHTCPSDALTHFRHYALDALQQCKVYLLDHLAAAYADTLHDALSKHSSETNFPIMAILGEMKLPSELVWVEFDDRALGVARYERASPIARHDDKAVGTGLRGFLIDDRDQAHLRITMFHDRENSRVVDPICSLLFMKASDGKSDFENGEVELQQSTVNFRVMCRDTEEVINAKVHLHLVDTGYDFFIPHALFALLDSPDLGGVIPSQAEVFTPKEVKRARKFGKSWITGAQKSHYTIRIGPEAAAHMRERTARLEFEREAREERSAPVRHWVSEHERHYRSGKVVLIKGYPRGSGAAPNLATRVMGPKSHETPFVFDTTDITRNDPGERS